jgi:hypothetical protein
VKSSLAVDQFGTQTDAQGRSRLNRLRLLDIEQMAMTLAFLAGYRPPTFGSVAHCPEPHCTACGESVGIFLGHGTEWRHFRSASPSGSASASGDGSAEVYDADHAPAIGWRYAVPSATPGR